MRARRISIKKTFQNKGRRDQLLIEVKGKKGVFGLRGRSEEWSPWKKGRRRKKGEEKGQEG